MRLAWVALVALAMVAAPLLSPVVSAGPTDECTYARYNDGEETGGRVGVCPGLEIDWEVHEGLLGTGAGSGDGNETGGIEVGGEDGLIPNVGGSMCRGAYGLHLTVGDDGAFACVGLDVQTPKAVDPPNPNPSFGIDDCPNYAGAILLIGGGALGACVLYDYEWFDAPLNPDPHVDTEACEMPHMDEDDGSENVPSLSGSSDPGVWIMGGGVAVCVVFIGEAPDGSIPSLGAPPVSVDLTPCEPESVDPTVYIGDGYVQVCISAGFH